MLNAGTMGFFEALDELNSNAENVAFTVIEGEGYGEKALFSGGAAKYFSNDDSFLTAHAADLTACRETGVFDLAGSSVYGELIGHEKELIVCGAGHVSMPVIRIGKMLNFRTTVIDDRAQFAKNAEAAGADSVLCSPFHEALEKIRGGQDSYFVIVTRGHQCDGECLRAILKKPYAYLGMMGSNRRVQIVKEALTREGLDVTNLHAPIGLAIHAETPEEIAVSIMAEIIQVKNEKKNVTYPPSILRDILGTVHNPLPGPKALCTIVMKNGAAPRDVGAKMLCNVEGKTIGTIGGGCTEAWVTRCATAMLQEDNPEPVLVHADLTADEAVREGEVCGGTLDVWVEAI